MSLSKYISEKQNTLFNECGVFWAFTNEQFERQCIPNAKYTSIGGGGYVLAEHAETFSQRYAQIVEEGRTQDLAENGVRNIIVRELHNYECFYINDISDCVDALKDYGITRQEIQKIYNQVLPTVDL